MTVHLAALKQFYIEWQQLEFPQVVLKFPFYVQAKKRAHEHTQMRASLFGELFVGIFFLSFFFR